MQKHFGHGLLMLSVAATSACAGRTEPEREGDPVDAAEERAEMQAELEAAGVAADTVVR